MSHSFSDETRSWDAGMVGDDWIAFPVCFADREEPWSLGKFSGKTSYWQEKSWTEWRSKEHINYFLVKAFRETPYGLKTTKGVTEGSETAISWNATFSTSTGEIEEASSERIMIRRAGDGRLSPRRIGLGQSVRVAPGQRVDENEVLASTVPPLRRSELSCRGALGKERLSQFLYSRERTQRFTGIKLSRLLAKDEFLGIIREIASDPEEALYVRLEAASYLAAVGGDGIHRLFDDYYYGTDEQARLEAVIATGEIGSPEAVSVLGEFLESTDLPSFLRSAAAWCLGRIGTQDALERLIRAFDDVSSTIREEALEGVIGIGKPATPTLLAGLRAENTDVAAGCAEALRQVSNLSAGFLEKLVTQVGSTNPPLWSFWLLGNLSSDLVASRVESLQNFSPQVHYALSILWSFSRSWISRRWEKSPRPFFEETGNV
jgi:hypothetical protein